MITPLNRNDRSSLTMAPKSASSSAPAASARSGENQVTTQEKLDLKPSAARLNSAPNHSQPGVDSIDDPETAEKKTEFVRHFILHQPALTMSAQANSDSQSALELLQ